MNEAAQRVGVQLPRARSSGFYQKTGDLAREAVNCNALLACARAMVTMTRFLEQLLPQPSLVLVASELVEAHSAHWKRNCLHHS